MTRSLGSWLATIGTWLLILVPSVPIFLAGVRKFQSPLWQRMFSRWGYPDHFYLVVGAVEIVAVFALLWPRTRLAASLTLIAIMIGATITHVMHNERRYVETLVLIALLAITAFIEWRRRRSASRQPIPG